MFDDINNMYDDLHYDSSHHSLDKNDDHQNNKHVIIHENPSVQESHLQESTVETQQLVFNSLVTALYCLKLLRL